MALTDTRLRTLKPAKGKDEALISDGNGLYIRIRVGQGTITRTWQFRRKSDGRLTIRTLGTYPELPIKEARLKAAELATKRTQHSPTVGEAAERWLAERIDHTHRKPELIRGFAERGIIPEMGARRVRDIQPAEIASVIRSYRERVAKMPKARTGGHPAARALLAVFKGLFGYCVANGWIGQSPAAQLTAAVVGPPSPARTRVLSDDEIQVVMTTNVPTGPVMRFLLATGLRLGEAYNGYREGQYWVVLPSASKNKREHRVWLSELALAQLDQHPWKAPRHAVQNWVAQNTDGWCAHDLRRTFATRNNAMGVPPYIVEKMLNHSFDGVMAVYNQATYDAERRQALEAWSAWLAALVEKHPAEVVSLRQVSQQAA
jgi:integrase